MNSLKTIMAGCLLVLGSGLAGVPAAQAGMVKLPLDRGAAPEVSSSASVCSAFSLSKHFTLADPDFGLVRAQLNATLATARPGREGRLEKAARHRIAPDAVQFGLRLDHARCGEVDGTFEAALSSASRAGEAKECLVPQCTELVPGWRAPDGSTLALWTCEHNIFREVIYERIDGVWVAVAVREEQVTSCTLMNDQMEERRGHRSK